MTEAIVFPRLPQWFTAGRDESVPIGMRPFGSAAGDLDMRFALRERPLAITEILDRCSHTCSGGAVAGDTWLRMPVSMRIEALLTLSSLSDSSAFAWRIRCDAPPCAESNEQSEFTLTLHQILSATGETRSQQTTTIAIGEATATFRRPTGEDQIEWLQQRCATEPEAMLRSIMLEPALDALLATASLEALSDALDGAMDSFDPLLGFHVDVVCPRCGSSKEVWPDLTGAALDRLCAAQQSTMEEVHALAREYGWTESEVLALPAWRRQHYLDLIRGEVR